MNFGTYESFHEYLIGCLIFIPLFMFRLNDIGLSPWISFFLIIPYFTFFFYVFLLIKPGINEDITSSDKKQELNISKEIENLSNLKDKGILTQKEFDNKKVWSMKKVYRTFIRVMVFCLLYFPLYTIPYYTELNYLTPIIVIVSFIISKPITKFVVSKFFSNLYE